MYKPSHIAKLNQIEPLIMTSYKVKSTIQKMRIGFGEMYIEGRTLETDISSIQNVGR
jgi:hypothetical protein